MKVFIASTSEDLQQYRAVAERVVLDAGWQPIGMEHFAPDPRPIIQRCRDEIEHCNLVVLIQAFRQGWVPDTDLGGDGERSITALEISAADEMRIPVIAF